MKLPKEIINGILIFVGISAYFLLMNVLGLSDVFYLRILNILFVFYGANRTIKQNLEEGTNDYFKNLISLGLTVLTGVILSVLGLLFYIYYQGGDAYINRLSENFIFGGVSVNEYSIGILFEGLASGMIVVFITLQYYRSKTKLNS
jgi:hypothetical protein